MQNILGTHGLTSSEANHVTNVTKELVKDLNVERLALSTSVIKKDGESLRLDENQRKDNWVANIKRVGELFALSAWLKSGIKLKEEMLNEQSRRTVEPVARPDFPSYPDSIDTSFPTFLNSLSVKEHNDYLSSEAIAAHIGKFIHNFDAVRKASEEFRPTIFQEIKNEVVVIQNTRLYTQEELSEGFFELQKSHREAERVVNNYKAKHKEWVKNLEDEYYVAYQKVADIHRTLTAEYNAEMQKATLALEADKREKKKEISNLKIVIPTALQETLDFVNQYAKK